MDRVRAGLDAGGPAATAAAAEPSEATGADSAVPAVTPDAAAAPASGSGSVAEDAGTGTTTTNELK